MNTAGLVLSTNTDTDRAFNAGVLAVLLATLGVLALLYYASVLSFDAFVSWVVLGVPGIGFVSTILFAQWLGYTDEARCRSLRYSVWLNNLSDE